MKKITKTLSYYLIAGIMLLAFSFHTAISSGGTQVPDIKIVDGQDADIKDYPWQVTLFRVDSEGNILEHLCGGSIIDEYWILTAAHCIPDKAHKNIKVIAQITNLYDAEFGQIMEITDYIIHENFDDESLNGDIALIRLAYPIDFSQEGAAPIRLLTKQEEQAGVIAPGTMATITGWGTTQYMGESSVTLQAAILPIISVQTANDWFKETYSDVPEVLESMLPAGFEEGGASGCHGDSGGPLVVKDDDDNWVLAGIASWGNRCGGPKQPSIYTRVSYYYDWIMEHSGIGSNEEIEEPDYIELVKLILDGNAYVCDEVINFGSVLIRNFGLNDLSVFEMKVTTKSLDGEEIYTNTKIVPIIPPLPPNGTQRVELPNTLPDEPGSYVVEVVLAKPNFQDVSLSKAFASTEFELVDPTPLKINLEFGEIMTAMWYIMDMNSLGVPIVSQTYTSNYSGGEAIENICLPDGEYYFFLQSMGEAKFKLEFNYDGIDYVVAESNEETGMGFGFAYFRIPFVPFFDPAVSDIYAMIPDSLFVCNLSQLDEEVFVSIRNNGTLPVENIEYEVSINGYIYSEAISIKMYYNEMYFASIEPGHFRNGRNEISIKILGFGDGSQDDKDMKNNEYNFVVNVIELPLFAELELRPDSESYYMYSWSITNDKGEEIRSENFTSGDVYIEDLCLPVGCYKFMPNDWSEMGMQRDTAVIMRKPDGEIIFAILGKDFVSSKPVDFCNIQSSVKNEVIKSAKVFPNPAAHNVVLLVPSQRNSLATIELIDISGRKVLSLEKELSYGDNMINIDVSYLPVGSYLLNIISDGTNASNRVIISR